MAYYCARRASCVGRNRLVPGVAGETAGRRMRDNTAHYNRGRAIGEFHRQLCKARTVVVDDGSRRGAMNKRRLVERRISKRARKRGSPRGYDLGNLNTRALEAGDDFHQAIVAPVRYILAFRKSQ